MRLNGGGSAAKAAACAIALAGAISVLYAGAQTASPRPVKVMIVSMFAPEGQVWLDNLALNESIMVPGLSPTYPTVHCNSDDVCQITTDMGKANAASSVAALLHSRKFDLSRTYFLVAGIAGVDPTQGTLGTAAWARYLVDWDIAWEIDAREKPIAWSYGYLGINTKAPGIKPPLDYGTEVFKLNDALVAKAVSLSQGVSLGDSPAAQAYRANYLAAPANQPPRVVQCDSLTGNNYWHGNLLGQRARDWVKLLTDNQGTYCMTQQEDNATYAALQRGAQAGWVDLQRIAVLRTASNFDRPYPGQTPVESLAASSGGFLPSVKNLYAAGGPLVRDIVSGWSVWKNGVPSP